MMATGLTVAEAAATTAEVETLRTRCAELQRQVRHLEAENTNLKAAKTETTDVKTPADAPPPERATVVPVEGKTHKIQQGETFVSIAKKYGIPIKALIAANPGVKPTALRPGQMIRLAATTPVKPEATKPEPPVVPTPKPVVHAPQPPIVAPATKPVTHAPQPPIVAPATKPVTPAPQPPVAASTPKPTAPPAASQPAAAGSPQELASSPKPGTKTRAITITKEITYGEFASQHGTDIKRLNELNGLDLTKATVLAKGSEIYVPGQP